MHPHFSDRTLLRTGALFVSVLLGACGKPSPAPEAVRVVRAMEVTSTSAGGTQEYSAEVRARTETRLGFRVGGKLLTRAVEVGQRVRPGDVLARLDPQDLNLGQDAARAAVQAAQVNHDLAAADFRRFKDLRDQGFISSAELDRRDAALKAAAAQLEQARAQAAVQANQASYSTLVATAAGVVVGVDAEPGAVLAAGAPVVRVALDGLRDAVFAVPEDAAGAMRLLQGRVGAVGVVLWGGRERFTGTIREVAAAADPVTRTYLVKAELERPLAGLGQTATVSIELPRREGSILLPLSAIKAHAAGSAVWVVDRVQGVVQTRPVQIAGAQGNDVVVRSGIQPGDVVVTAGVHVLNEGQKVRLPVTTPPGAAPGVAPASAAAAASSAAMPASSGR